MVEGSGVSCSGVSPMPSLGLTFLGWTRSDDSVVMVSTVEHTVRGQEAGTHCLFKPQEEGTHFRP